MYFTAPRHFQRVFGGALKMHEEPIIRQNIFSLRNEEIKKKEKGRKKNMTTFDFSVGLKRGGDER